MKRLIFIPFFYFTIIFLSTNNVLVSAQENGRFIDIRQIVKDTLDYVRTVPAPEQFKNMIYNPAFQQQPQVAPVVTGQNLPIGPTVFAPPTKNDVEKLFHLPADILEKFASDAGYMPEAPRQYNFKKNEPITSNSKPTLGGFNFNVANENGKQQTMQEIIEQLQAQALHSQTAPIKVTDNVQIEPMTTPVSVYNEQIKSEKIPISVSDTGFSITNNINTLPQNSTLLSSSQGNEKQLYITNNGMSTQNVSTSTIAPSFVQQPETTTNILNVAVGNFDLQGQEIILNGQKYILTKPKTITNSSELKNTPLKQTIEAKEEVKLFEIDTSNKLEKSVEEKVSDTYLLSKENDIKSEEKNFSQEDELKSTTTTPDNDKQITLSINPVTKTVVSESGGFVQSEEVKVTENSSKPTTELPKSLENLLMEQLEKEQVKAAEEQRKFLLRQRIPLKNDDLPSILLNDENVLKTGNTLSPLSIRKLEIPSKKTISKYFNQPSKSEEEIETTTKNLENTEDRVELLRKSFNEQRRMLAMKSRQLFTKNRINKYSQPFIATTFCQTLTELSKNVGINNIIELAEENCKVITNYYPDLTCNEVLQYAEHCSLLMKLEKKN